MLIQLCANDAELADDGCTAHTNVMLLGNIVKVDPTAISTGNDALGAQDHTETAGIQAVKGSLQLRNGEFLCGFHTPGSKDFVSVMIVMLVMTVTTAAATLFVIVVVMMLVFVFIIMMMVVALAFGVITFVIVVVMVLVLMLIIVMVVALAFGVIAFMVVVVMVLVFILIIVEFERFF